MLQAEIIGNIGRDAEARSYEDRTYVTFSVAHTSKKETVWVTVNMNGNGGGLLRYLTAGRKVFVRGSLTAKTYTDKGGSQKVGLAIHATEVQLCGQAKPYNSNDDMPE